MKPYKSKPSYHRLKRTALKEAKRLAKEGYPTVFIDEIDIPNGNRNYKVQAMYAKTPKPGHIVDNAKRRK